MSIRAPVHGLDVWSKTGRNKSRPYKSQGRQYTRRKEEHPQRAPVKRKSRALDSHIMILNLVFYFN
ncbi:MAG: hypothetical protein LBI42_08065 [Chitinispirillales bacterium]|nr:hypothetical protein [Chitinispirillales bacterium]